jgi:hypothetical protein
VTARAVGACVPGVTARAGGACVPGVTARAVAVGACVRGAGAA